MPEPKYPGTHFPVVFADGVSSASHGGEVVKVYLARFDPDMLAAGPASQKVFAQVVLPMTGFIAAAVFFESYVERLIAQGVITRDQVEAIRQSLPGNQDGSSTT